MRFTTGLCAGGLFLALVAATTTGQADNSPNEINCPNSDCQAPDKWFKDNKTPKVEGDAFPEVDADECDFYKFVWQNFLYVTQSPESGDAPRFVLFDTPNELFDTPSGKKLQMQASPARDPQQRPVLSLSVRNSPHVTRNIEATAIEQAGSQGVVVDHNNRCLYYGQHLNPEFVEFVRKKLGLTKADQIKDVPIGQPGFDSGCLELKSAWRALTNAEKQPDKLTELKRSYYITEAQVPTLEEEIGASGIKRIVANPGKPRTEVVALLGLHVVGTTPGHPEFVWGSFEHVENAPTPTVANLPANQPVNNARDFTLYTKGTLKKDSNVNPVPAEVSTPADPLHFVDTARQTLAPVTQVYREFNSGEDGISEDDDVCSLNKSVRGRLAAIPELAVWSNYQLIGATWLKHPGTDFVAGTRFPKPPATEDIFAGEKKLSNSTMETFTQHAKVNCFNCHDTHPEMDNGKELPGLKIKISHVIRNAFLGAPQQ